MKALSLRQPWAWIVVYGGKNLENRIWSTTFRGPFLIHAAKKMSDGDYYSACIFMHERGLLMPDFPGQEDPRLLRAGIIGQANLTGMVTCEGQCDRPWHMHRQYGV